MKNLKILLLFIGVIANFTFSFAQTEKDEIVIPNREYTENQQEKPYVILISVDGFRDDYFEKYNPEFLNEIKSKGVFAEKMIPAFPSVTFPNHYTLVTGMIRKSKDRKSTRLNSSHVSISYDVICLKK